MSQQSRCRFGVARQPMIKLVFDCRVNQTGGFGRTELFFGLPLELRVFHKQGQDDSRRSDDIFGRNVGGFLVPQHFRVTAQTAGQGRAQARFVRAALRRANRVAKRTDKACFAVFQPRHRPFDESFAVGQIRTSRKRFRRYNGFFAQLVFQEVFQSVGEFQRFLCGRFVVARQQRRIAFPADFDAFEQKRFGTRHAEQDSGLERLAFAENFRVGFEDDRRAASVRYGAHILQRRNGDAARILLHPQGFIARDFNGHFGRKRVDDRRADTVQTARYRIRFSAELAARMKRCHNDFQRRFVGIFRMRVDGDAATVVLDAHGTVGIQLHFNDGSVARDGFVHRVIQNFRRQVVVRRFVRAADVHAGTAADGFQAFQNLDVFRRIVGSR